MTKNTKTMVSRNSRIASLLGFVFVALFTIAVSVPSSYAANTQTTVNTEESSSTTKAKAELPREWNWKKADIKFDHMYRSGK